MKHSLVTIYYFLFTLSLSAQEIKRGEVYTYARKIVDTMASQSMHGRGYTNSGDMTYGDKVAANYIKTEFRKFGLKSFTPDYYQQFSFPVNTITSVGPFYWSVFKKELVPGKDFLVSPSSCIAQQYAPVSSVVLLDSATFYNPKQLKKFLKKKLWHSYIAVDLKKIRDEEVISFFEKEKVIIRGLIFIKRGKLTGDFSQTVDSFPSVQVLWPDSLDINKLKEKTVADMYIQNTFLPGYQSQNVIGYVQGSVYPDSFIVFSAHYDHLGEMGHTMFPGANDNASGSAMLLNLARYYSMPEHKPKCSIAFFAFTGEEVGLLGSRYYTEHPLFPLKNIKFLLNMDIMGTGEDGITVVNGSIFKKEFDKLKEINAENNFIKDVKIRGKAANSDHYFFSENGVRACFIYTMGGIKAYHDIYDKAETLPLNEFEDLFKLITKFGDYLQSGG